MSLLLCLSRPTSRMVWLWLSKLLPNRRRVMILISTNLGLLVRCKCLSTFSSLGQPAYFVNSNERRLVGTTITTAQCEKLCIETESCVLINYDLANGTCSQVEYDTGIHEANEKTTESFIVRCNRTQREFWWIFQLRAMCIVLQIYWTGSFITKFIIT